MTVEHCDTIGKRLRYFREVEAGASRERFTENLGITPRTLERYESDESAPDSSFLTRLNSKYQELLNLDWILTGRGNIYLKAAPATGGAAREDAEGYQDVILEKMHQQLENIYKEKDFSKLAALQSLLNLIDPDSGHNTDPG